METNINIQKRVKSIILSKEASYWGFFVPAMVNSIASFLYSMGSNVTLDAINGILMLFFTGCYYLFCILYFWEEDTKGTQWLFLFFIIAPLVIYRYLIQTPLQLQTIFIDMIQTSLYYLSFFGLFVMKYDVSKIARVIILIGLWIIASPLFYSFSQRWNILNKDISTALTAISPFTLIAIIICFAFVGMVMTLLTLTISSLVN